MVKKTDCRYFNEDDGNCFNFTYIGEYDPCTDGDLAHCSECYPHFFGEKLIRRRFKTREFDKHSDWVELTDDGHRIGIISRDNSIVDQMNDMNGWAIGMQRRGDRYARMISAIKEKIKQQGTLTEAEFLELIE